MVASYLDCPCHDCGELLNQTFDCACDNNGCYCYVVCSKCPVRDKCDAFKNPGGYPPFYEDDCKECNIKECPKIGSR